MQATSFAALATAAAIALAIAQPAAAKAARRYRGILPCADCSALRVDLTLVPGKAASSGRYRETLTYIATRDGDRSFTSRGEWKAARDGAAGSTRMLYRLRDSRSGERALLAGEGERSLRFLDADGGEIASPLPEVLWRAERRYTGPARIVEDAAGDGELVLRPGQELVVRLRSNPSTGYRWTRASESTGDPLALAASPSFARDPAREAMVGAGGVESWRFLASGVGHATLRFEYRRPWEKGAAPARTVSFDVNVREPTD